MKSIALKNSDCLLSEYPELANCSEWKKFATEFDKPSCIRKRSDARKAFRPEMKEAVKEMDEHCQFILNGERIANFGRTKADGSNGWWSREEIALGRIVSAVALAQKVQLLFSPSKEGKKLRNALRAEADRREVPRNRQDKASCSAVVCFAFLKFVHRAKRLPLKKELNVEANRLAKCEIEDTGKKQFGEICERDEVNWKVYDCISEFDFEADDDEIKWKSRVVPLDAWDRPKWESSSGLAEYSTPLGLKGLSEAHEDKGKKQGQKDRKKP